MMNAFKVRFFYKALLCLDACVLIRLFLIGLMLSSTSLRLIAGEMYDPAALYLTWQHSPQTTMTVLWITAPDRQDDTVEYQNVEESGWQKVKGSHIKMPDGHPYLIHTAELTLLKPDTVYRFRTGFDAFEYRFKTLQDTLRKPMTFAVGGDVYHDDIATVEKMNKVVANQNPDFALVGGDIAYSVPSRFYLGPELLKRWMDWLSSWKKTMITPDGRLIPILPAIGNHEVKGGYNQNIGKALFFYALFPMPGTQGYNLFESGEYLSIYILDSGHTHPVDGDQQHWLYHALEDTENVPHKFALYHVPAYPSVRHFDSDISAQIRKYWVPLFEQFNLHAAFENHDHAYKRSHPIQSGKVSPQGVVYFGDGGWGVADPRRPKNSSQAWYLAKTAQSRNVLFVTLMPDNKRLYKSIDSLGNIIDEYQQP